MEAGEAREAACVGSKRVCRALSRVPAKSKRPRLRQRAGPDQHHHSAARRVVPASATRRVAGLAWAVGRAAAAALTPAATLPAATSAALAPAATTSFAHRALPFKPRSGPRNTREPNRADTMVVRPAPHPVSPARRVRGPSLWAAARGTHVFCRRKGLCCDRKRLCCDSKGVCCHGKGVFCHRKGVFCHRKGVLRDSKGVCGDSTGVCPHRTGVLRDSKGVCDGSKGMKARRSRPYRCSAARREKHARPSCQRKRLRPFLRQLHPQNVITTCCRDSMFRRWSPRGAVFRSRNRARRVCYG